MEILRNYCSTASDDFCFIDEKNVATNILAGSDAENTLLDVYISIFPDALFD